MSLKSPINYSLKLKIAGDSRSTLAGSLIPNASGVGIFIRKIRAGPVVVEARRMTGGFPVSGEPCTVD